MKGPYDDTDRPESYYRPVFVCSGCCEDIYEGDDVYHIMGEQFCKKCIEDAREEATIDDSYREDVLWDRDE